MTKRTLGNPVTGENRRRGRWQRARSHRRRDGEALRPRGTRYRIRPLQPTRQGIPHREERRVGAFDSTDVRNTVPRFSGETGAPTRRSATWYARCDAEVRDAGADRARLVLAQNPWMLPIRGTTKLHRLDENLGAAGVVLAPDDLRQIDAALLESPVQGARYADLTKR